MLLTTNTKEGRIDHDPASSHTVCTQRNYYIIFKNSSDASIKSENCYYFSTHFSWLNKNSRYSNAQIELSFCSNFKLLLIDLKVIDSNMGISYHFLSKVSSLYLKNSMRQRNRCQHSHHHPMFQLQLKPPLHLPINHLQHT